MSSYKKQLKKDKKKRLRAQKKKLAGGGFPGGATLIVSPAGEVKMSEVLMKFVEPYSGEWQTPEGLKHVLSFAMVAWNAALLPSSQREEFVEDMVNAVPLEAQQDMRLIVQEMIQRKEQHFAGIKRTVIDCQVTMTPNGPHLSVLSTFSDQ